MTNNTETYRHLRRREFDRNAVFLAGERLPPVGGKKYRPGEKIDTSLFTTRRLRQLYDQRFLTMQDPEEVEEESNKRPLFEQMPTPAVIAWLRTRRKVPRAGSLRENVVKMADAVWRHENGITATESGS